MRGWLRARAIGARIECDVRGFKLSRAGTSTYWDRLDYVMLASTRPAVFEVDLDELADGLPRLGWRASVSLLAGTIISIIPILLAHRVIIEFHALNDMVTEPDADIGVRLYVSRHRDCDPTDIELWYCAKAVREIDFIARPPLNPVPVDALAAT